MRFSIENALIDKEEIKKLSEEHASYLDRLKQVSSGSDYSYQESSLHLPLDNQILEEVENLKAEFKTEKLKYILDIGIGGSNLGTKAVYDSFFGYFDTVEPERFPKIIFLDTIDPEFVLKLTRFLENLSEDEIIINAISKSGGTTETTVNFEVIMDLLKGKFPNIKKKLVFTTDQGSKLWQKAVEGGIKTLSIPKAVGGRYSVLSAVGLFPLSFVLDIQDLRAGAQKALEDSLSSNELSSSPAFLSAASLYLSNKKGLNINDNFFFHPELESVGKWYRQLMGESIGKEDNLSGDKVYAGITPTVSVGSTDLHSVGQLYLGGPKDKITTFIYTNKSSKVAVPQALSLPGLVENIEGKDLGEVMRAILEGVKIAYQKKSRPFMEVILDDLSEEAIGEFLQFKMIEMMFLGHLLKVNTFDQPNVEDYKIETKKILKS